VLFHHEPENDDAAIDRLLEQARRDGKKSAPALVIDAAREGMTLSL
jgi:hypothetical protein